MALFGRLKHKTTSLQSDQRSSRGQSFVELALVLPVLLIMLLGLIEVTIFISRYLDVLDLTREAARFASQRDPFHGFSGTPSCSDPHTYDFYYNTACIFAPPADPVTCPTTQPFCGGINPYFVINPVTDDVVVSVFTITSGLDAHGVPLGVTAVNPPGGPWALSDHDSDTVHNANWQRDCQGNTVRAVPYYTLSSVNTLLASANALPNRGYVAVEAYYCHHQVLGIPIISQYIQNPIQTHAYTIMSLPDAQPTPTAVPVP